MTSVIRIRAQLTPAEGRALDSAIDTLNRLMVSEVEDAPHIEWHESTAMETGQGRDHIHIVSLLLDLDHVQPDWSEHERTMREKLGALAKSATGPIFLLTIFRHVPFEGDAAECPRRLRLRRLNLLAIELSREMGVMVIDIDRFLADVGANVAQTDYHLEGLRASAIAGFAMAQVLLLDALLDHVAAPSIDRMAQHLEAERPAFNGGEDWPALVQSSWLSARPRRGFSSASTIYDDFDPNFVALQLKSLLQGKVTIVAAVKAIKISAGRHGVKATARRLWNGAAQLRKSTTH